MDNQKIDLILDKLIEQTESGKLNWKDTSNEYTYLLTLKDSSISLRKLSAVAFICEFRNSDGEIVESVTNWSSDSNPQPLEQLFNVINRKSLKTEKIIDNILEQLAA